MAGLFALLGDFESFTQFIGAAANSVRTVIIKEVLRSAGFVIMIKTAPTGFIVFKGVIMVFLEDLVDIIVSVFIFFETEVKFAVKTVVEAEV